MVSTQDVASLCRLAEERLRALYGKRMRGLVLYGSHARGEADGGSDVDLLVLLDEVEDFWREMRETDEIAAELSLDHDVVLSVLPVSEREFSSSRLPVFMNARREGVRVT